MNIDNKFLLFCLLQLIIISLMSLRVEGGSRPSAGHVNRLLDSIPPGRSTTNRAYRLYSRCSTKYVLIQDKVSATSNSTDFKGELELQTVMTAGRPRTRIHGVNVDRYICFNHKGRLVTKPPKKARGAKCEFVEEVNNMGYSQFRSAKNEDWFIGFNPRGKPLHATAFMRTRAHDCFDFLKLSNHRIIVNSNSNSPSSSSLYQLHKHPTRHHNQSNMNNHGKLLQNFSEKPRHSKNRGLTHKKYSSSNSNDN